MSRFHTNLEFLVDQLGTDQPALVIDLARIQWRDDEELGSFVAALKGLA